MFQTINGLDVYVVELKEFPPRLPIHAGDSPELAPYAQALEAALEQGVVSKPGKYAINITDSGQHWNIFQVHD